MVTHDWIEKFINRALVAEKSRVQENLGGNSREILRHLRESKVGILFFKERGKFYIKKNEFGGKTRKNEPRQNFHVFLKDCTKYSKQ